MITYLISQYCTSRTPTSRLGLLVAILPLFNTLSGSSYKITGVFHFIPLFIASIPVDICVVHVTAETRASTAVIGPTVTTGRILRP